MGWLAAHLKVTIFSWVNVSADTRRAADLIRQDANRDKAQQE
jgi:hypothetical protein